MGVTSDILIETPANRKHITGERIKGLVKFHLDKDTVYKKINLSLVEKGYCQWYECEKSCIVRCGQQIRRKKVGNHFIFEGHETKVVRKINLLNKKNNESTTLIAGSYERPFEMIIPENIPPSMKTDIGEIKYYLVVKFKKPRLFSLNKKFKTKITIHAGYIDSSVTDKIITFSINKTLNKLFSSYKQEINLKVKLDKGYLNPSGEIQVSYVATNNSNVNVSVKTELISKTKYKDDFFVKKYLLDDPKTVREVLYSCTVGTASVSENSISCMFVAIPVAPELCTVRHSKIITREYKLRVTLKVPLPHINSSVEIPVFVGERINGIDKEEVDASAPMEPPPSYREMSEEESKE